MMSSRRTNLTILLSAFLAGLMFGRLLDAKNLLVAQADTQNLAAIRAARGTMDIIQYDMERAGYSQFLPSRNASVVRVTYADKLEMVKADANELVFRSVDGRDHIVYCYESGQISRIVTGSSNERLVLLEKVTSFKVNRFLDGKTINVAFWYPVVASGDGEAVEAGQAPAYAHFVSSAR